MTEEKILLGSNTAKNGFRNEREIAAKFNNWQKDKEAKLWLQTMGYILDEIECVRAIVISGYKTDVNVQIKTKLKEAIDIENLQVKLVSNKTGSNQIDKRWVEAYTLMWNIPNEVETLLKHFTGELPPKVRNTKDPRRMLIMEFSIEDQRKILDFIDKNKTQIILDILKGSGEFSADWVLVAQKISSNARWILQPINKVINHYFGDCKVVISRKGSILIGRVLMQRKGGDNGRPTANMLQFKIDPTDLFDL